MAEGGNDSGDDGDGDGDGDDPDDESAHGRLRPTTGVAPAKERLMTSPGTLILVGGGGHAKVVADVARAAGWTIAGFLDDHPDAPLGRMGVPYLGAIGHDKPDEPPAWIEPLRSGEAVRFFNAIGSNATRRAITGALERMAGEGQLNFPRGEDASIPFAALIDPGAAVSPSAVIDEGALVGPRAIVNASARVGRGAIVNSGAIVEHDGVIGAFAHVAPGAVLGGDVLIGDEALVGLGARVQPGRRIGAGATIAAGAVVCRNVPDHVTVKGVPAR